MLNQFQSLDRFLIEHQAYWRFEPFFDSVQPDLLWHEVNPDLCQWLESLSPQQISAYKQNNKALVDDMADHLSCIRAIETWTTIAQSQRVGLTLPRGVDNGVPGRKLEQILAMGETVIGDHHGREWLEWCSGKGFLGRILASHTQQKVTSFEYQQTLCESGQKEADRQGLAMHFVQGDALSEQASQAFHSEQHAVALHACGDLHVSLIQHATKKKLPAITLSPCCYHLVSSEHYQALSKLGQASDLALTRQELRIPLQETVTGGERVKRHRIEEMTFRLGFDLLLRDVTGNQVYQPVPSIKKSALALGFEAFCRWASEQKGVGLPRLDYAHYEQLGSTRYWQMERMSLVQQPFRRALEIWLVIDKALYLQERGYQVTLSEFCCRDTTPRNLLIHAVKR
ncbi:SAM-dependent methyltransferase [Vibrio galatheae]|uniref:SAM-dependent methyltransferase n=1 Tax=Vibrio galatheae TaxID=579748 RepID=A0A0F4NQV1_9VIBR|nr:methyltransferase [Vibrio galatheae]KJY85238.1 SAM-dependent methyltransferase [Vibrio galatheae]